MFINVFTKLYNEYIDKKYYCLILTDFINRLIDKKYFLSNMFLDLKQVFNNVDH